MHALNVMLRLLLSQRNVSNLVLLVTLLLSAEKIKCTETFLYHSLGVVTSMSSRMALNVGRRLTIMNVNAI